MENRADLYKPVYADKVGPAPVVVRAVITPNVASMVGGVPSSTTAVENYILLSALPKELQERVRTAVQALIAGM